MTILAPYASYRLSEAECEAVEEETRICMERHAGRSAGRNRTGRPWKEQTRDSFGAEVALAKLAFGEWQRKRSDEELTGAIDVILSNGATLDSKSNYYYTHTLLICQGRASAKPDAYVLMVVVAYPLYEYRGWVAWDVLRQNVNWDETGRYGDPCWVLAQSALNRYLSVP